MILRILAANLIVAILMLGSGAHRLNAQVADNIDLNGIYEKIFQDFGPRELKSELISLFEDRFPELVNDIKNTTKKEEQAVVDFLTIEFRHYAEVFPLKHENPGEFDNWVGYKQREYRCMILGRKIKTADERRMENAKINEQKQNLKSLLAEVLEIKLKREQHEIIQLEKRLAQLKKVYELRKKNKEKILENRYDELVGIRQLYQW